MSWLDKVRAVFKKYNVPEYVWIPIMVCESRGNPKAWAKKGEDSRGLFQINIKANPQYENLDLFDPVVNAEVAARDFIAPAYKQVTDDGYEDPLDITEYVWHFGIRPYWDEGHKLTIRRFTAKFVKGEDIIPKEDD